MKASLLVLAISLTFANTVTASEGIAILKKTQEVVNFKKTSKTTFEMISNFATGVITVEENGQVDSTETLSATNSQLKLNLEITGKNIAKFSSNDNRLNKEVEASINKSLLGNIKNVSINGNAIGTIVNVNTNNIMIELLKGLRSIFAKTAVTKTTTGLNCIAEADLLKCTRESAELTEIN